MNGEQVTSKHPKSGLKQRPLALAQGEASKPLSAAGASIREPSLDAATPGVVPAPQASPSRRLGRWGVALSALAALTYFWPAALPVVVTGLCLAYLMTKAVALARAARAEALEPSIEERGHRCPFCHEDFAAGEVVESCAACETVHHAECREEFGACATFACEAPSQAGRRFAIAPDLIVGWEHPEAVEIEGEVATPFPNAFNYDPVTGLRRLGVEDYAS